MRGTVVRSASAISRGTTPALRHPLSIAELRKTGNGIVREGVGTRVEWCRWGLRGAIFTIAGASEKNLSPSVDLCGERGVLCVLVSGSFRERSCSSRQKFRRANVPVTLRPRRSKERGFTATDWFHPHFAASAVRQPGLCLFCSCLLVCRSQKLLNVRKTALCPLSQFPQRC